MKKSLLLSVFCFLIFPVLTSFAQATFNFRLPEHNEPIYGTWVNSEYAGTYWKDAQKLVFSTWGRLQTFMKLADEKPLSEGTFILVEKWLDPEGNTWYKEFWQFYQAKGFSTVKISKDNNTMEGVGAYGFVKESDVNPSTTKGGYFIFHREP
jgi:hypothetical protein